MRIEELSARSGLPVRTIREYQTWKVLPPPRREGRIGLYDQVHLRRLADIVRLQDRGYSIAAIRELFEAWSSGTGLDEVLGIDDALGAPADEAPRQFTPHQLGELLPAIAASPRLLRRAHDVGLLSVHDGRTVARSPALVQLVADAMAAGVSPTAALDLAAAVVDAADRVGAQAATTLARAVELGEQDPAALARRGRVLLARAVATHAVDRAGHHLARHIGDVPEMAELIEQVRIGTVVGPTDEQEQHT
jgi:DNA-binding transcriptional MerR regulator